MAYTLLQLVQQASGEMGLAQPTAVIGSAVQQTMQLLALSQALGKDLVREFEWQRLVKIHQFLTTASVEKTGDSTEGSAVITTIASTAGLSAGMLVSGSWIPVFAEILSVDSGTQITLNIAATETGSLTLTFKTQDYALPTDFDRMISDTQWNRTNYMRGHGSRTSQTWQSLQGGVASIVFPDQYRIIGNKLRFHAAPTSVQHMAFEYVSNYWVVATGGSAGTKTAFTADSDLCVFPDDLMLKGLKYYFLKAKKLDFGIELAEYSEALSIRKAQDVPITAQSLSPTPYPALIGHQNVPEGGWDL